MTSRVQAIKDGVIAGLGGGGLPTIERDIEEPERCPAEGLADIVFEDPEEDIGALGTGIKSWFRDVRVRFYVTGADEVARDAQLDGFLKTAAAQLLALNVPNLDHIEIIGPEYEDEAGLDDGAAIQGAAVVATLYYQTPENPLEA